MHSERKGAVNAQVVDMIGIVKDFPGVRALDNVSFGVERGEVHALAGKNGAGKSTLMHILNGLYPPDSGLIRVRGAEYDKLNTAQAKEAGISLLAQHANFIPGLTIAENLFVGDLPMRAGFVRWKEMYREAEQKLSRVGLRINVRRLMESTSVAERQMIEIARALFADASVVILDEPTAPLPKSDVEMLFEFIIQQKEQGASFIYISHYLEEIFDVADRVTVLRDGTVAGSAAVNRITQPELIQLISGTKVERYRRKSEKTGAPVLELKGLSRAGAYADVNLTIHKGEIVGLTGLEGSGPGELARGLFGLEPRGDGEVLINGGSLRACHPNKALKNGIAYLPRDRHGLGIVGIRSVRDNTSLSIFDPPRRYFGSDRQKKGTSGRQRIYQILEYQDSVGQYADRKPERRQPAKGGGRQVRRDQAACSDT